MTSTAAYLADYVFPAVPVRQWVLSVPFELRLLLAKRADALNAVGRIFVEEVFRWQRECDRKLGITGARTGAVQFPQRYGGSLNLNVHYHVAVTDGVFTRPSPGVRAEFHRLPRPSRPDLDHVAARVETRVSRWLRRKRLASDQADLLGNEPPERGPLDAWRAQCCCRKRTRPAAGRSSGTNAQHGGRFPHALSGFGDPLALGPVAAHQNGRTAPRSGHAASFSALADG